MEIFSSASAIDSSFITQASRAACRADAAASRFQRVASPIDRHLEAR
jgi:hypothetical protein